ncbi:hypothetical protein [Variovorax paradoxus]|jgi:hypothetical protein|uniref:Uncharacterized protein n=1 Tax=Variovorax paradoxus TaxID=34073 RepID=A0A679J5Y9_VARPD|nr:hypothetical protein VVAX_04428 [Variovorax paradoxus]
MADEIIAGQATPAFRTATTLVDTADLLEKKSTQLQSLLKCCYGDCSAWFDAIGNVNRDSVMWIASDLADEVAELSQRVLMRLNEADLSAPS